MQIFLQNSWIQILISLGLSLLPVLIWIDFLFQDHQQSRKTLLKVFLFGAFSVVPLLSLQYLWLLHPQFDVYAIIENKITNEHSGFLATFIAVGIFEEVTKFNMLRHLKWANVKIESINDAIKYILLIALGFSFTENMLYFFEILRTEQLSEVFHAFVFRSVFTMAAHMVFSSIVAYHYAIGAFGNPILELDHWTGKKHSFMLWLQKTFGLEQGGVFRLQKTVEGLWIAMGMHALFNFSLQLNHLGYAVGIVVLGFIMILYLRKKRMTYLVFTDAERARPSTIGKAEEKVVIELMGMWFNEQKYKEVIEICDRLLKRDPDNQVVKLFRAKAVDQKKIQRVKKAIHLLFSEEDYDVEKEELSVFERLKNVQQKKEQVKAS